MMAAVHTRSSPSGVSSRIRHAAAGVRHPWTVAGVRIDLPVIVDWVSVDPSTGEESVRIEARIDLVDGEPALVSMCLECETGLDVLTLQQDFRWASPLEVVTGLVPRLIAAGLDPYSMDLPLTGFPAVAVQPTTSRRVLSDEFLTTVAREYLLRGRGYAASLAAEYCVSPRTVVSWVEKARARGLLSRPPVRGAAGGRLM
jgi:hypothetical protein